MPMDPALPFNVTYQDYGTYLHARVSGDADSVATSLLYWRAIAEECRRRGRRRLVVVEDLATAAPVTDVFLVARELPEILGGIIVAFVDSRLDHHEANKFGEDVAVNRGAFGRVFADEESAADWINAGGPG